MQYPNLILGDCLEEMAKLETGSVDLVLTDPPYGTTACKWDAVIPFDAMWAQVWRVLKPNGAAVFTAAMPFNSALVMSQVKNFKYEWVWDKVNRPTGHLNAKKQPMRQTERVLVFYRKSCTYNPQMVQGDPYTVTGSKKSDNYGQQKPTKTICEDGLRYPRDLLSVPADERGSVGRIHPTQKPVALMEYMIKTYTVEGETVLDFTMGSGTTGAACQNTSRNFIGIEKDSEYFAICEERILDGSDMI